DMMMLFTPTIFICSRISCSAPFPMASMLITAATPKIIPSAVRKDFTRLAKMASTPLATLYAYLSNVPFILPDLPGCLNWFQLLVHSCQRLLFRLLQLHSHRSPVADHVL